MKRLVILSVIIIVIIVIAAGLTFKHKRNRVEFKTEKVTRGNVTETVTATGAVNPVTTISVGTQISGTIKSIYVDFNSPVKKGQPIAQIDPAPFEAKVEQSKANLLTARANLEKAKAALLDAGRTMERNRELFARNLIAKSDAQTSETNYDAAQAQVSSANAQVNQAEAALAYDRTNFGYTRILSPVQGVVIDKKVDVGQTVAASFQTPTLFTIAQDLTKMQIDASVDEADIGNVKEGQDVEFTVDAYSETTFSGKVWQVRNSPTVVSNVVTYDTVIKVANPELKLKPGMTANVSIIVDSRKDVLKIPNSALRFRPAGLDKTSKFGKGTGVWIEENGKPKFVSVKTGITDGNYTELVSGSLKEGQEVITQETGTNDKKRSTLAPGFNTMGPSGRGRPR